MLIEMMTNNIVFFCSCLACSSCPLRVRTYYCISAHNSAFLLRLCNVFNYLVIIFVFHFRTRTFKGLNVFDIKINHNCSLHIDNVTANRYPQIKEKYRNVKPTIFWAKEIVWKRILGGHKVSLETSFPFSSTEHGEVHVTFTVTNGQCFRGLKQWYPGKLLRERGGREREREMKRAKLKRGEMEKKLYRPVCLSLWHCNKNINNKHATFHMASAQGHEAWRDEVVKVVTPTAAALLDVVSTWGGGRRQGNIRPGSEVTAPSARQQDGETNNLQWLRFV